jgi:choline/carnitine/betaine transport
MGTTTDPSGGDGSHHDEADDEGGGTGSAVVATEVPPAPGTGVNRVVLWPTAVVVLGFSGFAIAAPDAAESLFSTIQSTVVNSFNWYYVLIAAGFVVFALVVGFSRYGDIRLGRDDEEPEFSVGAWLSMLFAAGMGIGLVFYGAGEPLSHFVEPRPGVEGSAPQLAQQALTQTYLHWGVHAWAIYVVVGLSLAYAIHRRGRPISIRWTLEPLLGRTRVEGAWGNAIDVLALAGTLFGVATSLGLGVLQISSGLESAGLGDPSTGAQIAILAVITVFVLFSVLSGVTRGVKWLSSANLVFAAVLVAYLLATGPTVFLLREWVQSIGLYIQSFVGLSSTVSAFQGQAGEEWQAAWTSFYLGWWISWAPFVGVFIARVSRGRSVREFVLGVLIVPTLIGIFWFAVLGGSALYLELNQPGSMTLADGSVDVEGTIFQLMEHFPGSAALTIGVIVLVSLFFVTSADSGALVMAMIATGGNPETSRGLRTFFTLLTSVLAVSLLVAGGLSALQTAAVTIALPFSVVMILICWATVVAFRRERRAYELAMRDALVDHIGDHYGLEVVLPEQRGVRWPRWRPPGRPSRPER